MHQFIFLTTTVFTLTKATPTFTLIDTFTGLADNDGTTESCTFHYTDNLWMFADIEPWNAEIDSLPWSYPWTPLTNWGGNKFLTAQTGNNDSFDYSNVMGTEFANEKLFFADWTGQVGMIEYVTRTGFTGNEVTDTYPIDTEGTNGICFDATTNIIYATNPGVDFSQWTYNDIDAGIWKIDLNDANPAATRVYTGLYDNVNDQNGNIKYESDGSTPYVFHPNGCAAKDGVIYFVESRADGTGVLGMLTVGTDTLSIDDSKGTVSGDGIVVIGNYIIYSAWRNGNSNDGALYYCDITTDDSCMLGIEGLVSPANIGVGPMNTICVPSLTTGNIYFVKFNFKPMLRKLAKEYELKTESDGQGDPIWAFNLAFDPKRKRFAYLNHNVIDSANKHTLIELNSDWCADETDRELTDNDLITDNFMLDSVIPTRTDSSGTTMTAWFQGATISNDIFYGTDSYGMLFGMNLTNEHIIGYADLGDYIHNFEYWGQSIYLQNAANGVCIDPDNENNAYVMDGVTGKIYSVNIGSIDSTGQYATPVKLYDASTTNINDQNDANGRKFYPHQCTIFGGNIYMVECDICWSYTNYGTTGALGVYKISDGSFYYNSDVLSTTASSIASLNGVIVITPMVKIDNSNVFKGIGVYDPRVDTMLDIQYFEPDKVRWSRQIAIDYFNGVIASVEDWINVQGHSGMLFYKADQLVVPTVEPSLAPSAAPTAAPSEDVIQPTVSPTGDDTDKASDVSLNMVIIMVFAVMYLAMQN